MRPPFTVCVVISCCCQLWALGASLRVLLSAQQPNCTWISLQTSTVTFELNDSSSTTFQPVTSFDGPACSVMLAPDPEFGLMAENFVFVITDRHMLCQLSVQIEDLIHNKTLSLCGWRHRILQTSVSIRVFTFSEPSAEPEEFQQHSDIRTGARLLTGTAFHRPRTCDEFKCRDSRICIPKLASCDGLPQCPDGSDEASDNEDHSCAKYRSESFSRIGIILTSALLISVGLVFAAVIRRTLLERLKKPSKYEVNPGKEVQYNECETSFMSPEPEAF